MDFNRQLEITKKANLYLSQIERIYTNNEDADIRSLHSCVDAIGTDDKVLKEVIVRLANKLWSANYKLNNFK